ncbi:MAG: hypothetical protein IJ600_09925 [Lachnospiraceae bacterium]|nr:hypothetical protein [Lachnospiraceae bacterium]
MRKQLEPPTPKELHIDQGIQDRADDMGIDWYSYWPDLEKVVIEER